MESSHWRVKYHPRQSGQVLLLKSLSISPLCQIPSRQNVLNAGDCITDHFWHISSAIPELSLQSILIISTIIGKLKTWTYVGLVALFSLLAGLIYGSWVDGANVWHITLYMIFFLSSSAFYSIWLINETEHERFHQGGTAWLK